jgi:small-conductance mechanosensitive channel
MPAFDDVLAMPLFSNRPVSWLIAGAVTLVVFGALLSARRLVRTYHSRFRATDRTEFMEIPVEVLSRTALPFFIVVSLFAGLQTVTMGDSTTRALLSLITIATFWQSGIWASAAASAWLERKRRHSMTADRAMVGSLGIIGFIVNVVIWALVILLTLDNLGINITALVAGLGIGGIAVALALQNILGDLFASLSITLDRPFVVGDFLIVGDFMGSVENIGIKSTRLRSLSGEQIVMPNADLLGSRVRNYGRMSERRVVFATSVTYETDIDLIERIPQMIRAIVESQQDTRFDRSHFAKHAAASLDYETVYYVLSADYNRHMDIQQAINLRLHRELTAAGVEFAYPTQKLYIVTQPQQDSQRSESGDALTGETPA